MRKFFQSPFLSTPEKEEPIAEPIEDALIVHDINNLTFENLIVAQSEFDILVAEAKSIPNVLLEIGRLREMTFRSVGEGRDWPSRAPGALSAKKRKFSAPRSAACDMNRMVWPVSTHSVTAI